MLRRVKEGVFAIVVAIITILLYLSFEPGFYRYLAIFTFMIIAIMLASLILGEEPEEFFDNFGNYQKARVSAILMGVALIALIRTAIEFFKG